MRERKKRGRDPEVSTVSTPKAAAAAAHHITRGLALQERVLRLSVPFFKTPKP